MIHLLSDETINQIAAGEVIENPASVVKELVENAVDAKATKITIEIKAGGFGLIRISDNGSGMSRQDATLSLQRHATSKIQKSSDLFALSTMGFRGEALASIASISQLCLITCNGEESTKIDVLGGVVKESSAYPRPQGTTIEVRSLFYNVPARKKFQKTPSASAREITKVVTSLSLANPSVSFELINQEKKSLSLSSSELQGRIEDLLGKQISKDGIPIEIRQEGISIKGVLGSVYQSRMHRTGQYLFVNGRPVTSPALSFAVKDGYGTRLDTSRHPIFVLHLEIDPKDVDVNVHPQKREVRFRNEEDLKSVVRTAVAKAFSKSVERPEFAFESFELPELEPLVMREEPLLEVEAPLLTEPMHELVGLFRHFLFLKAGTIPSFPKEGLLLVDLLRARSRIVYDAIKKKEEPHASQVLLFPIPIELTKDEGLLMEEKEQALQILGLKCSQAGPAQFLIEAIPTFVEEEKAEEFLREVLEETTPQRVSHFATRRKKPFMLQEAKVLVEELLHSESPFECPFGKKTIVHLSCDEIQNFFV